MGDDAFGLRRPAALDAALQQALAELLTDCVAGGASVGFMHPLSPERARAFWQGVADGVARGERALLVAEDRHGLCGTVQLVLAQPDNQPHRADVSKMLVHRRARRRGIGEALLGEVERVARDTGKTVLVLDTIAGSDAERLYRRLGWQSCGLIPDYALMPHGGLAATHVFYKQLAPEAARA